MIPVSGTRSPSTGSSAAKSATAAKNAPPKSLLVVLMALYLTIFFRLIGMFDPNVGLNCKKSAFRMEGTVPAGIPRLPTASG